MPSRLFRKAHLRRIRRKFGQIFVIIIIIISISSFTFAYSYHKTHFVDNLFKKTDPNNNYFYEFTIPPQQASDKNAAFKYSEVLFQKSLCNNRKQYQNEFYHLLNINEKNLNSSYSRIIVLGSYTYTKSVGFLTSTYPTPRSRITSLVRTSNANSHT